MKDSIKRACVTNRANVPEKIKKSPIVPGKLLPTFRVLWRSDWEVLVLKRFGDIRPIIGIPVLIVFNQMVKKAIFQSCIFVPSSKIYLLVAVVSYRRKISWCCKMCGKVIQITRHLTLIGKHWKIMIEKPGLSSAKLQLRFL